MSTLRLQNTELEKIFISYNNLFIHRVLVCKQENIEEATAINITSTEGRITFQQLCGASDLRLRGAEAVRNIYGSTTMLSRSLFFRSAAH